MDTDNSGTPNLGPCPLPRQKPSFEWFFVSEVIASGTTADQLLRLWEQGHLNMWVTLPSGAYFLPDNARYYHIEQFGPVQISSEVLPDMANHGEARIRLVATPPKYDDKWRMIKAGQFFELPDPPLIKFERLRIIHSDFAHIIALQTFAEIAAEREEATLETQEECEVDGQQKKKRGRPSKCTDYQVAANIVAVGLWRLKPEEMPQKKRIANKLASEIHAAYNTVKDKFEIAPCHEAIMNMKRLENEAAGKTDKTA